jgi:homoserine O-succinyltransferase
VTPGNSAFLSEMCQFQQDYILADKSKNIRFLSDYLEEKRFFINPYVIRRFIMPIIIPQGLPATENLIRENIFVINELRASHQDIRPLKIGIVNLMPNKIETETQLLRLLSNYPLQVQVELIATESYRSSSTPPEYLRTFYRRFSEIKEERFDGMIITGAPVEKLPFSDVLYWEELKEIMDFTQKQVTSTLHICWAAQAALYYHFGIHNYILPEKIFGVFPHHIVNTNYDITKGFDDEIHIPHSRWTEMQREEIARCEQLDIVIESPLAGVYLVASKDQKNFFVNGHAEYDAETLKNEYERDQGKGLPISPPYGYFPANDPARKPLSRWRALGYLLFSNWLNYHVYQVTPYDLTNGEETHRNLEF